jgi:N2-acetyl-L-2,4-diaminobutanoate deacetylase
MPTVIYDPSQIPFDRPGKHHYQIVFNFDSSYGGSLVPLTVINGSRTPAGGELPRGVAVFGGTHGNEWEGQVAIKRLCADLKPQDLCGRVILIPQLSEPACRANTRVSPLDGVNMNRAFPGNPRGSISYRISNFVKTRIFPQVGIVLDIHSGGREGGFALCTSFHAIPDPAQRAEIARVAQLFDTPFVLVYSNIFGSGLLTDEAESEGKITVGGEFGQGESTDPKGTLHAYEGIKNVLRHYGMLPDAVVKIDRDRQSPPRIIGAENLEDYIPCPRDGIWEPLIQLGSDVRKGDLIGRLHDFDDHSSAPLEVIAHRSGVLVTMHLGAVCKKGYTLYVIAEDVQF